MNNAFNFFEQIYCISLEYRKDRQIDCQNQFLNLDIEKRINKKNGIIYSNPNLNKKNNSQIGCTLSHYNILKESQKNNFSNVLVFEDDFLFLKDKKITNEIIEKSVRELPIDWDIFYFGSYFVKGYDYEPIENYSNNLIKINTGFCTHAISYSKNGINKILKKLNLETEDEILNFSKKHEVIDWYLVKEFQKNNKCFAPKEFFCSQKNGISDIEGKYFDYNAFFLSSYSDYVKKYL